MGIARRTKVVRIRPGQRVLVIAKRHRRHRRNEIV